MLAEMLQFLVSGLTVGAVYALVALGFTLIYNASDVVNFAQGEFVMLGGMVTVFAVASGIPLPLAAVLAILAAVAVGLALHRFAIEPARGRSAVTLIIITIGASIFLRGVAQIVFDKRFHQLPAFSGSDPILVAGAAILPQSFWVLGGALVVFAGCSCSSRGRCSARRCWPPRRTGWRRGWSGVDTSLVLALSFGLSAAIGALAGILITPITLTSFDVGTLLALKGFAAAMLGGMGSPLGAVVGGLVLGLLESVRGRQPSPPPTRMRSLHRHPLVQFVLPQGLSAGAAWSACDAAPRRTATAGLRLSAAWPLLARIAPPGSSPRLLLPRRGWSGSRLPGGRAAGADGQAGRSASACRLRPARRLCHGARPKLLGLRAACLPLGAALARRLAFSSGGRSCAEGHYLPCHARLRHAGHDGAGRRGRDHRRPDGIRIPRAEILGWRIRGGETFYWIAGGALLIGVWIALNLQDSPSGRALAALHDSEVAARTVGIDVARHKLRAFVIAAVYAAVAGGLLGAAERLRHAGGVRLPRLGRIRDDGGDRRAGQRAGRGGRRGAAGAAAAGAHGLHDYEHAVLGLLIMLFMIFLRVGIVPGLAALLRRKA
jgi:branched-chain amino acid transport system permease protein